MAYNSTFPNTLYILDPSDGFLYSVFQSTVKPVVRTVKEAGSILVSQNQTDIYTVNREDNSITRILKDKGRSLGEIRVGKRPYGICEDPNGIIYVTNYGDNSVSVIKDNVAELIPIQVDKGPRGIVSDSNGTIWVACYLSNTVVKIVNRTVVDRIPVAFNPEGITCDIQNNIWVACSGSNKVVKISRSKKTLSVDTGKRPISVVVDRNMNVYVANFEDDTVTIINGKGENAITTTVAVGDGPSAIAIDSENKVYVASNIFGEDVYVINPISKKVMETIHVCTSPSAFGDFTGCATFNVFNPYGKSSDNGIAKNAEHFLAALEPTFIVSALIETPTQCIFKIDSELLNLNADVFQNLTLNGVAPSNPSLPDMYVRDPADYTGSGNSTDTDGYASNGSAGNNTTFNYAAVSYKYVTVQPGDIWFTLDKESIGGTLRLVGYFKNSERPIYFKPVVFRNIFSVKVGMVDRSYNNWCLLYEKVIDFNRHDIVASVVNTGAYDKGHVVCLVPQRIYAISKDYLTVNSGYAFGNGWLPDLETQQEELNKIMNSGITTDDLNVRTILFNPDETEAASLFFFHFYRIES